MVCICYAHSHPHSHILSTHIIFIYFFHLLFLVVLIILFIFFFIAMPRLWHPQLPQQSLWFVIISRRLFQTSENTSARIIHGTLLFSKYQTQHSYYWKVNKKTTGLIQRYMTRLLVVIKSYIKAHSLIFIHSYIYKHKH